MISVIMSVYNEPIEWMSKSINSILNQTLSDFEFIIINDNPMRNENKEFLDYYSLLDHRIKIIQNKNNIGLTKSLNKAISLAKGDFIARMDADDIAVKERFECQIAFFLKHSDCDICASSSVKIDQNGKLIERIRTKKIHISMLFRCNPICHSSVMFKKKICSFRNPLYNENFKYAQDAELWIMLFANGYKFEIIEKPLIYYRITNNQISCVYGDKQFEYARNSKRYLTLNYLARKKLIFEYNSSLDLDENIIKELLVSIKNKYKYCSNFDKCCFSEISFSFLISLLGYNYKNIIFYFINFLYFFRLFSMNDHYHVIMYPFNSNKWSKLGY